MTELKRVLMERDKMLPEEAEAVIIEMRDRVIYDGEDPDEVLYEIGLEPDYIQDLLDF